jgi:hypothetical protein
MPLRANSFPADFVNAMTPAFDAEYADMFALRCPFAGIFVVRPHVDAYVRAHACASRDVRRRFRAEARGLAQLVAVRFSSFLGTIL